MAGGSNTLPIGQSVLGSTQRTGAAPRGNIGKRYCRLLGQRGVLAHTRGVREPSYTYTSLRSRNYEITMLPCFLPFHTSRSLLLTHHPDAYAPSLSYGI